jgi:hypothetical protein
VKRKTIWTVPEFFRPVIARLLESFYPRAKRGRPRRDLIHRKLQPGYTAFARGASGVRFPGISVHRAPFSPGINASAKMVFTTHFGRRPS